MKRNDLIRVPLTIYSSLFPQQAATTPVEMFRLRILHSRLFGKLDAILRNI